jgi:ribosomal protein S17
MSVKFPHKAPRGMYYEQTEFKRNVIAIWVHYKRQFDYNNGDAVRCIWGFYNTKTKSYHAPINSSTVGSIVDIDKTTPYSAMQLNLNPLEAAFS